MNLLDLTENLNNRLQQELPGEKAQYKMISYKRIHARQVRKTNMETRLSAVLILLYPSQNQVRSVLIQRPNYNGVHSAQIGFPGGKKEEQDHSLEQTALRETQEEIGIAKDKIELIGKLSEVYIPPSKFLVTPYIGFSKETPSFILDSYEVQEIIEFPIELLLEESIVKKTKMTLSGTQIKIKVPYFDINGNVVWGATAMMISELKEILIEIN